VRLAAIPSVNTGHERFSGTPDRLGRIGYVESVSGELRGELSGGKPSTRSPGPGCLLKAGGATPSPTARPALSGVAPRLSTLVSPGRSNRTSSFQRPGSLVRPYVRHSSTTQAVFRCRWLCASGPLWPRSFGADAFFCALFLRFAKFGHVWHGACVGGIASPRELSCFTEALDPLSPSDAMTSHSLPTLGPKLDAVRGASTPTRRPNVRTLATHAQLSKCGLASLTYGLGVNGDLLLDGLKTSALQMPFGQSPFAMARGRMFENYLVRDEGQVLVAALERDMGFSLPSPRIVDLRKNHPRNSRGLQIRADKTKRLLVDIVQQRQGAPHLIVGAVFEATIAGIPSFLEADAVAARDSGTPQVYAGEIKSFPKVDGRIDSHLLGKATDQAAVYQLLLQTTVEAMGGDPSVVSPTAMIITPVNTGFQPSVSSLDITSRVQRTRELLKVVPTLDVLASKIPAGASYETVASKDKPDSQRIDTLAVIADAAGTHFCSSCMAACPLFRFCRSRAHSAGELTVLGDTASRLLPGIGTMADVRRLAAGDKAPAGREPQAAALVAGQTLYDRLVGVSLSAASSVAT
jgi:hypothetical protein